jgi:hypothetical protein
MRTLLIGALAATSVVGCSCTILPSAGSDTCTDASGAACLNRMAASPPVEPEASSQSGSAAAESKSATAAKPEKPPSAHARDRAHPAKKTAKSTTVAAKVEPAASRIKTRQRDSNAAADTRRAKVADADPRGSAIANSNSRTVQEQVAAATAAAEQTTVATLVPASDPKASPNNTDLLVVLVMARPEIKNLSDLSSKIVAIDDRHSLSNGNVRTAIAAAGAAEVQLSDGQAKAIDRLISGEVPAAVVTLASADAAERFPEIAGFKIFRIPLSPRSLKTRRDTT